ncbi:caspase family protein [Micromonospora sp. CPCC 205371]|nr:caspase family protein [Micromonospora sp. CPCC 205371]
MRLPIATSSSAVLIGCSRFDGMEPLPAVIHNVSDLRGLLMDEQVWGLPPDRCVVMAEPTNPGDIIDTINRAAARATDTFLVYYAGHGLLDDHGRLHLGIGSTRDHQPHTALSYEYVRAAVRQYSKARLNIVVLDCCYSGSAIKGLMGAGRAGVVSAVDGAYVLTSSAANEASMAPPGDHYTAFSGELIRLLRHGEPDGGPMFSFDDVFQYLSRELAAKSLPQPQQAVRNDIAGYAFAPNRAHAGSSPAGPSRPRRFRQRRRLSPAVRRAVLAAGVTLTLALGTVTAFGLMNDQVIPNAGLDRPVSSGAASTPPASTTPPSVSAPLVVDRGTPTEGVGATQTTTPHTERRTLPPEEPPQSIPSVAPLGRPALVSPPNDIVYMAPDTVNYSWRAVNGASGYTLETEATDGENWQPVDTHQVSGTSFSEAWAGWQKFRWRVTATATDGRRSEPSEWRYAYNNSAQPVSA